MSEESTVQFKTDRALLEEVGDIFSGMGLDMQTALRLFLVKVKQVGGLPFDANISEKYLTRDDALKIIDDAREQLAGIPEMSFEEIDSEIAKSRVGRRIDA